MWFLVIGHVVHFNLHLPIITQQSKQRYDLKSGQEKAITFSHYRTVNFVFGTNDMFCTRSKEEGKFGQHVKRSKQRVYQKVCDCLDWTNLVSVCFLSCNTVKMKVALLVMDYSSVTRAFLLVKIMQ